MDKGIKVQKEIIGGIAIYKFFEDFSRYLLGILLIIFGFDLHKLTLYFSRRELIKNSPHFFMNFLMLHIQSPSSLLTHILAFSLIIFSLLEIYFLIGFIFRKKWGGIGFFCMQFVWVPVDLLIISKFLLFSKIITTILGIVIVGFMIKMLLSPKGYFKK